ncbi:hypothetical protein CQA38_04870 [Campylobacter sp. MIT 12-5580]|uniref:hypothetical protein n=1 Tax=Campylobacter sp. MIT 12-5580 TaxID=2040651 RepID=UPI0010F9450B|nr:hypothetical protein [Campylobacter sp. MIT 12-5580]TKX29416.1 hypothetical protein CQA38_04870 [Campylobacter sp. MIT 12-5580]
MKKLIIFISILCSSLYSGIVELSEDEANKLIEQRQGFFTPSLAVPYDKAKIELDFDKKLEFIDLCKYKTKGYEFPCGEINDEKVGIRKYFIKTKSIAEAFVLFRDFNELETLPKINLYDYGEDKSNKEDEVGLYYIFDKEGRFWVIAMGYDSGSISIYKQEKEYIEVIYQWSVDW